MWVNKMKIGRIVHCAAACIPSRRAAFVATVALFAALGAQAATYWLGTGANASDSNDGTSKDEPFATWEYAFNKAGSADGNVLNVLPGTYTVAAAPATWATSRNDVTIQGVDADGNPLASAQAASAVVVDGAGLGTIAPVKASIRTTISGITFRNGRGAATTGAAIHMQGTGLDIKNQAFVVSNCVFEVCIGGPAVYSAARGGNGYEGCVFFRNANSVGNATAIHIAGRYPKPMTAKGCRFVGNDGSGASSDKMGVVVYSISPVEFSDCTFDSNTNTARGVALYLDCAGASNHFERCTFSGNANVKSASSAGLDGSGGVLYVGNNNSTNVFVNCTFAGNSATGGGGCVMLRLGRFVAEGCTFSGNSATHGTAVASSYDKSGASSSFVRCTISGNMATDGSIVGMGTGGALAMSDCEISGNTYSTYGVSSITADSSIERCIFRANTTPTSETSDSNAKAALRITAGTAANCLVACNTNVWSGSNSAGVFLDGGTLKNFTVVGNHSVGSYPGVNSSYCSIVNTVICGNTYTGKNIYNMSCFSYCVCDGTKNSDATWNSRPGCSVVANLADYGFTDAANGEYTLRKGSVCRNAGDNSAWSGVAATDLNGKMRINPDDKVDDAAIVDIGCYEFFASNAGLIIFFR